ncbi:MAG TPA: hypothetical protein VNS12_00775 [Pelagibacterium sp.]|uniref:hypothetical protein n=1 Tax=Pelagibacterium sp. TaxID=1967288 RepID=UPI002C6E5275|nr:hypothetical protein [Pelagibacterium sp.]HWJ86587.1 hypothetical protein [Pelagibacterium sp.]
MGIDLGTGQSPHQARLMDKWVRNHAEHHNWRVSSVCDREGVSRFAQTGDE